jgi:hypothetical protein
MHRNMHQSAAAGSLDVVSRYERLAAASRRSSEYAMALMVTSAKQPSKPDRLDRRNSRAFAFCTHRKAVTGTGPVRPYFSGTGAEKLLTVSNNR